MSAFLSEEVQSEVLGKIDELVADLVGQLQVGSGERPVQLTPSKGGGAARRAPVVRFPTRAVKGMMQFAQYLRVLELVQSALRQSVFVTKRSIYYQSMHVFESQQASDRVVEQLVMLLGCQDRSQLGVIASPRGLVAGNMVITHDQTATIKTVAGQSTMIPPEIVTQAGWRIRLPAARSPIYVLLVEKETVFKTLVQLQQRQASRTHFNLREAILVTGRGYADQATRVLINLLAASDAHQLRFLGLFDCDPYGIDIHRQYRQTCPQADIQWLGVTLAHFLPGSSACAPSGTALIPLRTDERLKAVTLLRKLTSPDAEVCAVTQDWICMLTDMLLYGGYKIEVEACYTWQRDSDAEAGLAGYIAHQVAQLS